NRALEIKPNHRQILKEKQDSGEELIHVCCITKDYQLAEFILRELQKNPEIEERKQNRLKEEIENSRNANIHYYLERLQDIETRFKSKDRHKGDVEDAIFEIATMPEEEICDELLVILQKGVHYFSNEPAKDVRTKAN
ncbi:MAG: hypothetical protein AABZ60_21560, partial [Planctomycetota bacterium]